MIEEKTAGEDFLHRLTELKKSLRKEFGRESLLSVAERAGKGKPLKKQTDLARERS